MEAEMQAVEHIPQNQIVISNLSPYFFIFLFIT